MSVTGSTDAAAGVGIDALDVFVEVLSQSEGRHSSADDVSAGPPAGDGFYDHLCDAVCRLARMRRALIFRYDAARRRVRAAGAHGVSLERFADAHVTVESAPIAAESLREDRVIEVAGEMTGQVPEEYAELFPEPVRLVCAPMGAAGRHIGVIFADRLLSEPPLDDSERHLLWTLGKAAALASVARIVATQAEKAHQLEHRIDLAREIHEGVIQRLFGISMALDGEGDLPAEARERCAVEIQEALSDLRTALQRPLGRAPRATQTTFVAEVKRLARVHPDLGVTLVGGGEGDVPAGLEPIAQSVLAEAVRNAHKHARPSRVDVHVARRNGTFVLEVTNDGVSGARHRAGMGLRLAALEALQSGGVVEFGEREPGTWQVRLVVPIES
jgi:signal transduction histidine kinase